MSVTWKRGAWLCSWAGLRGPTGLRLGQKWILESRGLRASSRPDGVYTDKTPNEMSGDTYTKAEMVLFALATRPESCSQSAVRLSCRSVSPGRRSRPSLTVSTQVRKLRSCRIHDIYFLSRLSSAARI